MNGYESLVWIKNENGREFYYKADAVREDFIDGQPLNKKEQAACTDVSLIIGTERWYHKPKGFFHARKEPFGYAGGRYETMPLGSFHRQLQTMTGSTVYS